MKIAIIVAFIINLIFCLVDYLHMFQLNFYKTDMHLHWCKSNLKKIALRTLFVLVPLICLSDNLLLEIVALVALIASILLNLPKRHAKIPLKITGRILRLFVVEAVLITLVCLIQPSLDSLIIRVCILTIISPLMCLMANFILMPAEELGRKRYIDGAKQILKDHPDLTIIGITGSYGKTSMKTYLYELLSQKYEVLKTPENYNTPLGIARTIKTQLKPTHEIFICEMGAMWRGEITECCELASPKLGIITSIGPQHLQTFGSLETIIETKFELAEAIRQNNGTIFLNYDNENIAKHHCNTAKLKYGIKAKNLDYKADKLQTTELGQSFEFTDKTTNFTCETKLLGQHNIENLTGAIAVARYLGVPEKDIQFTVKRIKAAPHRLELNTHGNLNIIDDSYNSNPVSANLAVDTLCKFTGKHVVITPGLIELGDNEERYNQELGEHIAKQNPDYVYLVGKASQTAAVEAGLIAKKYPARNIQFVSSPTEATNYAKARYPSEKLNILLLNDLPDNY